MASITAIVPTFNRATMVGECIASLLSQTRPLDQIIVVNDGSTDSTMDVLRGFGSAIEVIDQPNGGKSAALNTALVRATGELVWICDDDDYADPQGAAILHDALVETPDAPFAWGRFAKFSDDENGRRFTPQLYFGRPSEENFFLMNLEEMYAFQFAMLVRRNAYSRVGPFRTDMVRSQDFEMLTRLAQLGQPAAVDSVIFYQRQHDGARGSAAMRFSGSNTHAQAIRFGGSVLRHWRDTLPVDAFAPSLARGWVPALAERTALLQRGLTMAQRSLWSEAVTDLAAAAALGGDAAPAREERALARAVIRNVVPWTILATDDAAIAALAALRRRRYGATILTELVRPLVWRCRTLLFRRDFVSASVAIRLLVRLLGPGGTVMRMARNALRMD